ncbi:MAG: protein kinase [Planctomycetaceae bacterium]|nr:protein kinase [Planctomycetaceae bacterium]
MTSTDSLNTLATVECPSSERLKHYLSGWLSDGDAEQLEQHLHACEHCESAMRQLDVHQETLLQSLQATMVQEPGLLAASAVLAMNGSPDSPADPSKGGSDVIDEALSKARRLLDTPLEAENDPKPVAWHPTHRDFGCYELLRPLGRGGMGAVYLARHRQLGKQVAIKLLPVMSAEDSDVRTRFDREIRVVGRLNHPSIVAATDAGEIEGTQFLVMEYVPGLDLSRLARLMGRLPVAEACELIRQASLGLSCAHAEGVVHRDIKPSNLMLDDLGRIRILDFGLAQWTVWDEASVDLTTVGQLMGTLDYMAPEQAEAIGAVDYRADLYALGATLFRLLCGRAPLAAAPNQSPLEKLRLLSNHQPPKLSTLCPEAPEELVKLVASLLSRSPSDRPASAAHVAEQLAPFAEGAKLVELLQQAKEKAAASPELLKRTALYEPPFPGSAVPMSPPEPAASSGGRFKTLRRLLLAASLPLMIVAGILIKLELNKGQLIIESDVDNVNVKVLKDGKPVDGIQVNHGTTSTRLYADNYEITIDGPSDGLIIDHDKFTLKNGETVVARISRESVLPHSGVTKSGSVPDKGVDVLEVVVSLENHSKNLNSTIVDWLKSSRLPNSDNVLVDMAAFLESVRRLRSLKGDELTSPEQQLELEALYRSWRTLYQHLSQCQMAEERQKLSESAREINSVLIELDAATPNDRSFVPLETTPLYNGLPLSYWLAALRTDRSPAKQRECLEAIRRLATVADSAEATTGLTEFLRAELAEEQDVVDELGFVCIALLNPDQRFLSWWMQQFQTGNESWKARLSGLGAPLTFRSGDQLAEFEHWVKALTAQKKLSREDVNQVADFIAKLGSTSECSREVSDRLVQLLDDATKDDRSWWLSMPHQVRFDKLSDRYEFLQLFSLRSCRIAFDVIGNPESTSTQIAQAAMVFHSHLDHRPHESSSAQNPDHFRELHAEPNRTCFLNAAEGYLKRIKSQPARMTEFIKVPQEFEKEAKYQHFSTTSRCGIKLSHEVMPNGVGTNPAPDCRASPLIEVLDAIYLYTYTAPQDPALNLPQTRSFYVPAELTDTVKALRSELQALVPQANLNGPHVNIVLSWPELLPAGPFWSESPVAGTGEIWGQYTPTSDDWLRLCVLNHQVLNSPFVGEHDPGLTTTVTDPSTPAAQTNSRLAMQNEPVTPSPLYNGQPLEHWLDMIGRERSVEGLKVAFEACDTLVSKENSPIITETLLKFLPVLDGELKVLDKEANRYWTLDYEAARLLWKANPGAQFFTLWVKERSESRDEKWKQRLDQYATYGSIESSGDVQPFVEWARLVLSGPKSGFFEKDGHPDPADVQSSASLLRGMLNNETLRADETFVSTATAILTESPYLGDKWWLSEPLLYRGPQGDRELWPTAFQQNVVRKAIVALQPASDPALVAQACMILANGAKLDREQTDKVLQAVQKRIEQTVKTPEFFTMVHVPESFSSFAVTTVDTNDALKIWDNPVERSIQYGAVYSGDRHLIGHSVAECDRFSERSHNL